MKSYEERLPLIDEAIEYHNGKWPQDKSPYGEECLVLLDNGNYITTIGIPGKDGYLCNKIQFNRRAKELGYINGYKYGVEYETNGEKPDLPGDVLVRVMFDGEWTDPSVVDIWVWDESLKFSIVDERYNPKPNDWHERGELPPVGSVVEARAQKEGVYLDWKTVEICGYHSDFVWFRSGSSYLHGMFPEMEFRPLRTETDKIVDEAMSLFSQTEATTDAKEGIEHAVRKLIEAGYRKVKPMSKDEFVQDALKHFSSIRFDLGKRRLICDSLRKLHSAGCRFIGKGGNDE